MVVGMNEIDIARGLLLKELWRMGDVASTHPGTVEVIQAEYPIFTVRYTVFQNSEVISLEKNKVRRIDMEVTFQQAVFDVQSKLTVGEWGNRS